MSYTPSFNQNALIWFTLSALIICAFSSSAFGVTVDALQAPIKDFKVHAFNWMKPVQIAGGLAAIALSLAKQSFAPLGVGAGGVMAIQFFDMYLGDGAAGALI